MPKDIYEFAYVNRDKVLHPKRQRPALLDNPVGGSSLVTEVMRRFGCGQVYLPREAWEAARVA